jgi:hypothetical protein
MRRRRVRWANVAKLAVGLAVGLGALITLPSLLAGPEPPPPPPDVGLAPVKPATPSEAPADAVEGNQGKARRQRCLGGAGSNPRERLDPVTRLGRKLQALQRRLGDPGHEAISDERCKRPSSNRDPTRHRRDAQQAGRQAASSSAPRSSSPRNAAEGSSLAPPAPAPTALAPSQPAPAPAPPGPTPAPPRPTPAPPPAPPPPAQPTPLQQEFGL